MPSVALFGLIGWEALVGPAVGGVLGGLTIVLGLRFWGGRRADAAAPNPPPSVDRDPFVVGSATERRLAVRRSGNSVEVFISDADAKTEPTRGWVVDRSVGGLCLLTETEASKGAILSVLPENAPKGTPWTQVEIKSCRQEGPHWELGCQFVRTPAWSVLLLFG
jgi:hypothetical protein